MQITIKRADSTDVDRSLHKGGNYGRREDGSC